MKKMMILVLLSMVIGLGNAVAQETPAYEGEISTQMHSVTKMKSQVLTKNILAKMILKKVMKKVEKNGSGFNGTYTATTIFKGYNKFKTLTPYNNSVTIVVKDGDNMKTTTYFPYIKKGYYQNISISANKKETEAMQKGDVAKTGETIVILGYKCDIYQVKSEVKTDTAGTKSTTIMNHQFAVCSDSSCPGSTEDVPLLPGVKGAPLKYINNTTSMTSNDMLNLDFLMYLDSETKSITPRKVEDSEFEIPSDIKLIDGNKDPEKILKITEENTKYMKKKKLWTEKEPDEVRIFDNLQEDWDY